MADGKITLGGSPPLGQAELLRLQRTVQHRHEAIASGYVNTFTRLNASFADRFVKTVESWVAASGPPSEVSVRRFLLDLGQACGSTQAFASVPLDVIQQAVTELRKQSDNEDSLYTKVLIGQLASIGFQQAEMVKRAIQSIP